MRKTLTILALAAATLLSIGLVVLASAGSARGVAVYGDSSYFIKKQLEWLLAAVVAALAAGFIDYRFWRDRWQVTAVAFAVVIALLAAVFFFPKVNGSYRWIRIGSSLRLQPSELAKLMTVFAVSVWLDRAGWRVDRFWRGAAIPCAIVGAISALLVAEPDFGSTAVVAAVGVSLMFLAGTRLRYLSLFGAFGVATIGVFVATNANRMARIMAWWHGNEGGADSESTRRAAYQLAQAITAIGNGGLTGVGLNQSMQKQYYLPEAHTDFIFAIGAEEMGIGFSIAVLALISTIFICGMYVTLRAKDRLGRLMAFGMTFLLVVQGVVNIGVVTGCLPTKGLALPLVSYGGTNLISAFIAIAVIMNVGYGAMKAERAKCPRATTLPGKKPLLAEGK